MNNYFGNLLRVLGFAGALAISESADSFMLSIGDIGYDPVTFIPSSEYTVKRGDSLSKIAKAKGTEVERLLELNPGVRERHGYMIFPEEKIILTESIAVRVFERYNCGFYEDAHFKKLGGGTLISF